MPEIFCGRFPIWTDLRIFFGKVRKIGAILSGEVIQVIGTELPDSKWEKIKEDIIMIN